MTTQTTAMASVNPRGLAPKRLPGDRPSASRRFLSRLPVRILLGILLIIVIYPMVWMFLGSFKTQSEFLNEPFWSLPQNWSLDNYVSVFENGFGQYILNSIIVVFPSLAVVLIVGVAAGFALEVMVWKGRGTVLLLFLAGIMVPTQMILLPLFTIYFRTGLTGTYWPMILTYIATGLPLTVFMMATFFRSVAREIFEASTLDGASIIRSFWAVGLPLVKNAVFTVGLVQFFFFWNDLLIALTFTNSDALRTIQVGLLNFTGQYGAVQYGPTFAAIAVSVFGTLLIYLFLNQQVMKGLTAGSVKG
ncbi:MAG: carbohydrate ABC transporter permease [Leifsonia sp.]